MYDGEEDGYNGRRYGRVDEESLRGLEAGEGSWSWRRRGVRRRHRMMMSGQAQMHSHGKDPRGKGVRLGGGWRG